MSLEEAKSVNSHPPTYTQTWLKTWTLNLPYLSFNCDLMPTRIKSRSNSERKGRDTQRRYIYNVTITC